MDDTRSPAIAGDASGFAPGILRDLEDAENIRLIRLANRLARQRPPDPLPPETEE